MIMPRAVSITGNDLTLRQFCSVVFDYAPVRLAPSASARMQRAHALVQSLAEGKAAVYGVNTGFGKLSDSHIGRQNISQLQLNLVRSHACGVGDPLSEAETRGMMLCRGNVLAKGYSGTRPEVVVLLLEMLNRGIHPVIPSQGSVGASGDLAPLAHLALVVLGEGEACCDGKLMSGRLALKKHHLDPLRLQPKEGISLLNGTQGMLSVGAVALSMAESLVDTADVAAALSLDALKGTPTAFDARIQRLRPYPGQALSASHLRRLNAGSEIRHSHLHCAKVQDAYSLRCAPQVHGAIRDVLTFARRTFAIELNAATDNPLVFTEEREVLSGGNFHGQPLALALDFMGIALTELASIAERRIERLINPEYGDLPPFLTVDPGLNSGFMMLQVTAAALTSECKVWAHPASVDSIPTSGNREDHVSMGMGAALKLKRIVENLKHVLAIELLGAAQGIDFLAPLKPGRGAQKAYDLVRSVSSRLDQDRSLAADIQRVCDLIAQGRFSKILNPSGRSKTSI
ncbi:MAG: histidine ammonia-lyase [Acidobacteria bacterium]|nr:histidine ammonia-lyase [Acidobacteriota bacterium]MCI0721974.1 histidine ammonia-lyase [Acidobacteriota bacterium]